MTNETVDAANQPRKIEPMTLGELSSSLHAILFSYERVMKNFFDQEYRNLLGHIIEQLNTIYFQNGNPIIDKNLSLDENAERLSKYLSNEEFFENLSIRRMDEDHLIFEIERCNFAKTGVHEILNIDKIKGYCPLALIAAAVLCGIEDSLQYIEITDSEFTGLGSTTILKIK